MSKQYKNKGNASNSQEIPYEPLPEIVPPGILPQHNSEESRYMNHPYVGELEAQEQQEKQKYQQSKQSSGKDPIYAPYPNGTDNGVDAEDVERMRGWEQQNKL